MSDFEDMLRDVTSMDDADFQAMIDSEWYGPSTPTMPTAPPAMAAQAQTSFSSPAQMASTQIGKAFTTPSNAPLFPQQQRQAPVAQMTIPQSSNPTASTPSQSPLLPSQRTQPLFPTTATAYGRMLSSPAFCGMYMQYQLRSGAWAAGLNGQLLLNHPELRGQIMAQYLTIFESEPEVEDEQRSALAESADGVEQEQAVDEVVVVPRKMKLKRVKSVAPSPSMSSPMARPSSPSVSSSPKDPLPTPAKSRPSEGPAGSEQGDEEMQLDDNDDAASDASPEDTAPTNHPYTPDIASPNAARHLLAHPDKSSFTSLDIKKDDLPTVKTQMHHYASLLFSALQQKGSTYLPKPIKNTDQELRTKVQARYEAQQIETLEKIQGMLRTSQGRAEARARCLLVFEEAIKVHELGIKTSTYDLATAKPKPRKNHAPRIDLTSICSVRLAKMIEAVSKYKLVAIDVLEGWNLASLAMDPEHAAEVKSTYLESNVRRQITADQKKARAEKGGKRKRGADKGAVESGEESDGGESEVEMEAPRMRKRVKSQK